VASYKVPLSSDSYSKFGEADPLAKEYNKDVDEAVKYLYERVIPGFAKELDSSARLLGSFDITSALHAKGTYFINETLW